MKEFESDEAAEKYFREVLAYGPEWKFWTSQSQSLPGQTCVNFSCRTAFTTTYYTLKPKLRRYKVETDISVEAETPAKAVALVVSAVSTIGFKVVIGPAKEVT